ncbi:hypothetical protein [Candidatus Bodocaedibacter vickermanii]|uniref:Uncharacterized protein n=1 Tax=Candidatus Bodocaedibacter vickermanii TaxID=2741701 RepID=A0A7L9RSV3_9PROT|nr:hypothetical protein CPBP_00383 [Candidatus Paracaedibacteraceae bacterium 'Lake Konstanz']
MLMNIFRISVCVMLMSFFNVCTASETLLDEDQPAEGTPSGTPAESRAMFAADTGDGDDDADAESNDGTVEPALQSATVAIQAMPSAAGGAAAAVQPNEEEFVNVPEQAKILPEFSIVGGMYDALDIPNSTMPYTAITLANCTCNNPLDPSTFQNNSALVRINLSGSQLNFRYFEEKFGAGCLSLTHINLMGTIDGSVDGYPIITPERFAQLAHPDILQRILHGQCSLFISHPERVGGYYIVPEMQKKFLSSILQLRSLNKAKETLSTYQSLINMLRSGIEGIDPRAVAAAGANVAFKVCTGL